VALASLVAGATGVRVALHPAGGVLWDTLARAQARAAADRYNTKPRGHRVTTGTCSYGWQRNSRCCYSRRHCARLNTVRYVWFPNPPVDE